MSETEYSVPAKWKEVRRQCAEFLEYPGTPSTKPIEWGIQIIDDLACAEAQFAVANERIAELERIVASMKLADHEKADSLNSYRVYLETAIEQRDEARREVERLSIPVTDEEMDLFALHVIHVVQPDRTLPVLTIDRATALIASRTQKGSPDERADRGE